MRNAPAYSAERFPGDFAASVVCATVAAATAGPLAWWLARSYLQRTYPHHPEILGSATMAGLLDGLLTGALAFAACFALRIWRYERQERKRSDEALRRVLAEIALSQDTRNGPSDAPLGPPV